MPGAPDIDLVITSPSRTPPPVCPPAAAIVLIKVVILVPNEALIDIDADPSAEREPFILAEQEKLNKSVENRHIKNNLFIYKFIL
jgi:hypothetical protein